MLFNNKDVLATVDFKGFEGIDVSSLSSGGCKIREMVNFRILPDGSIEKRAGFRPILKIDGELRAVWTGAVGEEHIGYMLLENTVYRFSIYEDGTTSEFYKVGEIETTTGRATIFYYMSGFFLIDGKRIYDINEDSVTQTVGYAPLLGKEWGSNYPGKVYEELNALTNRVRISYIVSDPATIYLPTLYDVESIDAVYINGTRISDLYPTFDSEYKTIKIGDLRPGDRVLAYVTLRFTPDIDQRVFNNTEAFCFGGVDSSRVFMWNQDDSMLFSTSHVDNSELLSAKARYPESSALYIPIKSEVNVGDGRYAIRAVDRHYDRLMIFTEGDTWMSDGAQEPDGNLPVMYINSAYGCVSCDASAKAGNKPITVVDGEILRWMGATNQFDECNYEVISGKIRDLFPEGFYRSAIAFEDKIYKEVLFALPGDPLGRVYVFGEECGEWYVYDGIFAERFFDVRGQVGFLRDGVIYVFKRDQKYDILEDGTQLDICAHLTTGAIDFGYPDKKKKLGYVSVSGDSEGGDIEISFGGDLKTPSEAVFSTVKSDFVETYSKRLTSSRFRRTEMTLRVSGRERHRIYRISVCAKQ